MKFVVDVEDKGRRLDKYVVKRFPDLPRNQVKRLIDQENILVNEEVSSASYSVRENDAVIIKSFKPSADPHGKKISLEDIEIIEDDEDYLVINKPAGLIVHKTKYIEKNTLVNLLLEKYPDLEKVGEYKDRPGIVHRLDKEVSGLMVIPKNQNSFNYFKEQFQQHRVDKEYLCLVYGVVAKDKEVIESPIKRSGRTGKMITASMRVNGSQEKVKEARTEYRVVERFVDHTLLKVKLITGRTHQIRVHMKSKGYPIVGDNLYTTRKAKISNEKEKWQRLFLVAHKLSFLDPQGKQRQFYVELPEELQAFLVKIQKLI